MIKNSRTIYMIVYNYFQNDSRVLKEAETLSLQGYCVHIIAVWKQGLLRYEKYGNITIYRLNNIPQYFEFIGEDKFEDLKRIVYKRRLAAAELAAIEVIGAKTLAANIYKSSNARRKKGQDRLKFFVSTFKKTLLLNCFYRAIEKFIAGSEKKADVFHAHDLNTLFIACKMAHKYHAKLVYDSHELYIQRNRPYIPPGWFLKFEEAFERKYIKKADAVISVSHSIVGYLKKKYNIPEPYLIMNAPSGETVSATSLPKEQYSLRRQLKIDDEKKILLYTGSITFGRGLEKVIESMKYLKNFTFVMMGYGSREFKNHLMNIARNLKVEAGVIFYGPVPSDKVTLYASSADIGIAPIENVCLSYYYCAPNKIFEYIQSGLPVVASNFPDMRRIVEEHNIGFTCNTSDPTEIYKAVTMIMSDYSAYLNRVNKVKDKYCWEREAEKLKQLYCSLFVL